MDFGYTIINKTKQKTTKNETSKQPNKKMFPVAGGGT